MFKKICRWHIFNLTTTCHSVFECLYSIAHAGEKDWGGGDPIKRAPDTSDEKDYKEVIEKSPGFMESFPESKYYDVVLLNLGQAYEGLLATKYYKVMEDGEPEDEAKKVFMEKYGHYQCWVETSCGLSYDLGTLQGNDGKISGQSMGR